MQVNHLEHLLYHQVMVEMVVVMNLRPVMKFHVNYDRDSNYQMNDGHNRGDDRNRDDAHGNHDHDDDRDGRMHTMEYQSEQLNHGIHCMDRCLDKKKFDLKYRLDSNMMLLDLAALLSTMNQHIYYKNIKHL